MLPSHGRSARHHAGAFKGTFLAAGHSASDIEKALALGQFAAAHRVGEVAVAAVYHDVALFKDGDELFYKSVHRSAGFDHHEDLSGLFEICRELFDAVAADEVLSGCSSGYEIIDLLGMPVINGDCKAPGLHVHRQILAHYCEANHCYIGFFHLWTLAFPL